MALTTIEYGSLASSATLNNNFNYLDGRITTTAGSVSSLNTQISTVNTNLSNNKANIDLSNVTDATLAGKMGTNVLTPSVLTTAGCLTTANISSASTSTKATIVDWVMPDYTQGVSVGTSGFTATSDGVLNITHNCGIGYGYVYIDEVQVFSAGPSANTGTTCQVLIAKDSVVTHSVSWVTFYPLKGV